MMERMLYLSKQKKIWREKLTFVINYRIFDLKELERMEVEETARFSDIERQPIHITI